MGGHIFEYEYLENIGQGEGFVLTAVTEYLILDTMSESTSSSMMSFKNIVMGVCGVVVVVAVAAAAYFYMQYAQAQKLLKNPNLVAQQQTDQLISAVGKLMELPKNETPTIATVSDVSKLKDQPFFALAKNGDKVLIYTNAKKAILYRPSENKIIDVAPVNIGNSVSVTPSVTPKVSSKPSVSPTVTP